MKSIFIHIAVLIQWVHILLDGSTLCFLHLLSNVICIWKSNHRMHVDLMFLQIFMSYKSI